MQIEVGAVLNAKITGITSFGAFAELPGGKSGLIHISEISTEYVESVNQYLKKGQNVKVKVIGNEKGKLSLSIKRVTADEQSKTRSARDKNARDKKNKKANRQKLSGPPEEFEFVSRRPRGDDVSFDDMLKKFKQDSDERFQDLKRSNDNKRSGGYKRLY